MKKGKEIEKIYLLKEDGKIFATDEFYKIFDSIQQLFKDVLYNGRQIVQGYLPIEEGVDLAKSLSWDVDFPVNEARLRNDHDEFFYLTLKSDGMIAREELEDKISKKKFDEFWSEIEKKVEKMRIKKSYKNYVIDFDIYFGRDLITAEIEVPDLDEADKLAPLGKDVTDDPKYKAVNLAK